LRYTAKEMRCLHAYINEAETTLRMQNQMLVKNVYRKFGLDCGDIT
jgi:hypothetical protein